MPKRQMIEEESQHQTKEWRKYLEKYKRDNPKKANKAAVSILQKDGISLQDQLLLKTKFAVSYNMT